MKKIIFILVLIVSCSGCKKDNNEIINFKIGTFYGEKAIYYLDTYYESVDTITIKFDSTTYAYSGCDVLDFGRGNYLIKDNSIEFNDQEGRVALYTWDWIITGIYGLRTIDDSLILNQNSSDIRISCRLRKITK
jgi:hypothetical protein